MPSVAGKGELAAILFVNDTNVIHLDMKRNETALDAYDNLQDSVTS